MHRNSGNENPADAASVPVAVPVVDSNELLSSAGELAIIHERETYRLRKTPKGD